MPLESFSNTTPALVTLKKYRIAFLRTTRSFLYSLIMLNPLTDNANDYPKACVVFSNSYL